jgi:hypothetical protein
MRNLEYRGKAKLDKLYHGSGWWALSHGTVATILDRYYSDLHLRESFEFSAIPEEQYFHTIIGLSNINRPRKYFMHVDWDKHPDIKPYIFSEFDELMEVKKNNPELLFVRKTDMESTEVRDFVWHLLQ